MKTFIRTIPEVNAIAQYKPFDESRMRSARALMALRSEVDDFHVHGREVYWLCLKKQSESKFSNASFERALKVRVTFRSVNTVARLAAKYAFLPGME